MKNVLFLGRKKWSISALKNLLENDYNIIGVVGKSKELDLDVKEHSLIDYAKSQDLPIYDYKDVPSLIDSKNKTFDNKELDIIISYLFWGKIKKQLLDIVKYAPINFHPAPLPEYQGLGGYNIAILDELDYYGVTAHIMSEEIDSGDILKVNRFEITQKETAFSLEQKSMYELLNLFEDVMSHKLEKYISNKYPNNIETGRYITKKEFEEMKYIHPEDSQEVIEKKIRAFWYPPYDGAKVKIGENFYTLTNQLILREAGLKYHK